MGTPGRRIPPTPLREDIRERVPPRALLGDPTRAADRAMREEVAARCAMRELDALAVSEKEDGVISDDVTTTERVHADLFRLACAGTSFAAVLVAALPRVLHDITKADRGPARRIDLHAV